MHLPPDSIKIAMTIKIYCYGEKQGSSLGCIPYIRITNGQALNIKRKGMF